MNGAVIITGINGLLGPVWAKAILEKGAHVWGLDIKLDELPKPLQQLKEDYPEHLHLAQANVCDKATLEAVCETIAQAGVPLTGLVNNAGIDQPPRPGKGYRIDEFPFDEFRRVLDVNLAGAFLCTQVFGAKMMDAGQGSIVNIGSLYASVSPDERMYDHMPMDPPFLKPPAYGASKAGLLNLTRYLAAHMGKYGVRVNALSPGGVLGGQDPEFLKKFSSRVPLGRLAEHSDLGAPLTFLLSEDSAYITGQNLQVDGGFTCW